MFIYNKKDFIFAAAKRIIVDAIFFFASSLKILKMTARINLDTN